MGSVELSEDQVLIKCKASCLSDVKSISFWGAKIGNVDIVSKMPNLESASLSANNITSLRAFSCCPNLKELFVRRNKIENLSEFDYLKNLSNLRVLWASDNPVSKLDGYREYVIRVLPQITKLDEVDISDEEREAAKLSGKRSRPRLLSPDPSEHSPRKSNFLNAATSLVQELSPKQLDDLEAEVTNLINNA